MGWSFFNDVFRCTERDVPCGRDVRFARATQIHALDYGDPAGYCVLAGKRRTQAKE